MTLQQFSGPVMAKGVEDTAFYRYNRFVALNEVGGAPERFGFVPTVLHKANAARAQHWPHAMLATATHDTKRGEDNRARLAVLSELPEEWRGRVEAWSRVLRARRGDVEGVAAPDRVDEYMLYQMLVGSWPMDMLEDPGTEQLKAYGARIHSALEKSLREAKRRSSWAAPNAEYEEAMQAFAREALRSDTFLSNFLPFVQRVARLGVQNSLAQTVGKLTAPGVPDIYQGCELWDLSLVDPDNRRPVDFARREAEMAELARRLEVPEERLSLFKTLMHEWRDGRVKLATTALLLALRRKEPELFNFGDYQPIVIEGDRSDWVFGYVRARGEQTASRPDCALPRASGGGTAVERGGAIAGGPLVRPVSRSLRGRWRPPERLAASASVRRAVDAVGRLAHLAAWRSVFSGTRSKRAIERAVTS